ncbi:uncharacterized protein BP01DRAFT_369402 [Aspergillus saccharolyticus JOP 1030-1]|uniref:DUF7492 domain-containing protein n=1 Tax=Aspergillus saccharolyticus JOP 1030-1 TaxID=1450539 RepID=A0A318Z243_9EURO|nr:hypothetical protein BP01DRAFT_369402 [Aspergillus saccharolyticus JOP 1030-1]PYH40999.1 hypothetical protein BP01DRAFT_369402 [Aspergillus saccharolyticus JOP 1030-1]
MRLLCIYLTLAIPHAVFAMIKINGLQILNNASSAPHGAWGYARNYSDSEKLMPYYTIGSADLAADFCSSTQRVPFQIPLWPRLKAYPGSTICPHYTLENLTNNGSGVISWYGTSSPSLGSWTLSDVLMLEEIDAGLKLTESKYADKQVIGECFTSFKIPESISETTLYTVYWLWNTSVNTQNGFLLYTSCIDIEIILEVEDSLSTTAPLGPRTTTSYAANAPSNTGLELVSSDGIIPPSTLPVSRTSNANLPSSSSQEGQTSAVSADTQAGLHNSTLSPTRTSTKVSSVACTASSSSASARMKTTASTQISGSTRLSVYRAWAIIAVLCGYEIELPEK